MSIRPTSGAATAVAAVVLVLLCAAPQVALANDDDGFCRKTAIQGYEQYFIESVTNGDAKGTPFVFGRDEMLTNGYAVMRIRVWTGERFVTGIELTTTEGDKPSAIKMYGHTKGKPSEYFFEGDEIITYWKQYKSKDGAHKLAGIEFKTNKDRTFKKVASSASGGCRIGCPDCMQRFIGSGIFVGLTGYICSDNDICSITPLFMQKIASAEMTDMKYPNIDKAPVGTAVVIDTRVTSNPDPTQSILVSSQTYTDEESVSTTFTTSKSFKYGQTTTITLKVEGKAPTLETSAEIAHSMTWETEDVTTNSMTRDKKTTTSKEFNMYCPACSKCRFNVWKGSGMLSGEFSDFTATYKTTLETGATLAYKITGNAPTTTSLYMELETFVDEYKGGQCTKAIFDGAVAAATSEARTTGKADKILTAASGPVYMYKECDDHNGKKACKKGARVPRAHHDKISEEHDMHPKHIRQAHGKLPKKNHHHVINIAAPFKSNTMPSNKP